MESFVEQAIDVGIEVVRKAEGLIANGQRFIHQILTFKGDVSGKFRRRVGTVSVRPQNETVSGSEVYRLVFNDKRGLSEDTAAEINLRMSKVLRNTGYFIKNPDRPEQSPEHIAILYYKK